MLLVVLIPLFVLFHALSQTNYDAHAPEQPSRTVQLSDAELAETYAGDAKTNIPTIPPEFKITWDTNDDTKKSEALFTALALAPIPGSATISVNGILFDGKSSLTLLSPTGQIIAQKPIPSYIKTIDVTHIILGQGPEIGNIGLINTKISLNITIQMH